MEYRWGLLGPETAASQRRTRTLGLGAAVRALNDLAVPGLGGVWFGKQLYLAILGVAVAESARRSGMRVQNIEVTNAIEALACWLALEGNGWRPDSRVRGARKMRRNTDLSFAHMRKPGFYVTQPMRQATVQPLRALGLAESAGERFNAFRSTPVGQDFIDTVGADCKPHYTRSVQEHITRWVTGEHDKVWSLAPALSPIGSMLPRARDIVRERLAQGPMFEASRREAAIKWISDLREKAPERVEWTERPPMLDESHWHDLLAGALFFTARDSAIGLLDQIEAHIGNQGDEQRLPVNVPLPDPIAEQIAAVRVSAATFLKGHYDPTPDMMASHFCRECTNASDATLLSMVVARCEGRGLQQRSSGDIVPGVAFRGAQPSAETARSPEEEGTETAVERTIPLPEHISHRVRNLYLLHLDLRGELQDWLSEPAGEIGAVP